MQLGVTIENIFWDNVGTFFWLALDKKRTGCRGEESWQLDFNSLGQIHNDRKVPVEWANVCDSCKSKRLWIALEFYKNGSSGLVFASITALTYETRFTKIRFALGDIWHFESSRNRAKILRSSPRALCAMFQQNRDLKLVGVSLSSSVSPEFAYGPCGSANIYNRYLRWRLRRFMRPTVH